MTSSVPGIALGKPFHKEILPQNDHSRSQEMKSLEIPKQVLYTKILQVKCSKGESDPNDLELGRKKISSEIETTPDIQKVLLEIVI